MSMLPKPDNKDSQTLDELLDKACGVAPTWTKDKAGNNFGWLRFHKPDDLVPAVKALKDCGARLCTVTAYSDKREDERHRRSIAYHFALGSVLCTVTIPAYDEASGEALEVPSITPYFRNADWNEREFQEMYAIKIKNHPNPRRLFLDERIDAGIMDELIPFSSMVHGASSKDLWEQVMMEKTGYVPGKKEQEVLVEPAFTPVSETQPKAEAATADNSVAGKTAGEAQS